MVIEIQFSESIDMFKLNANCSIQIFQSSVVSVLFIQHTVWISMPLLVILINPQPACAWGLYCSSHPVCLSVTLLPHHNHTNNLLLPVVICFMLGSYPSAESGVSLAYLASSLTITAFTCATFIAWAIVASPFNSTIRGNTLRKCLMYLLHLCYSDSVPKSLNALHKLCLVLQLHLPPDVFLHLLHLVPEIFLWGLYLGTRQAFSSS